MTPPPEFRPDPSIPIGTQVVLRRDETAQRSGTAVEKRAGTVGQVSRGPDGDTRHEVSFADGAVARVERENLRVRRLDASEIEPRDRPVESFEPHLILRVLTGSTAYGLTNDESDRDERGVFLPPADWTWSLRSVPEQIEFKRRPDGSISFAKERIEADDFCWWELEKFLRLLVRANPTALEVLFVPDRCIVEKTAVGDELLGLRGEFLTKQIYQTYSGYALSQFRKMKKARAAGKPHKPKHAMHLVRLLYSGIAALETGHLPVDATEHRDELFDYRQPDADFDVVHERALELDERFRAAFDRTTLPERVDIDRIDDFLIRARRTMA